MLVVGRVLVCESGHGICEAEAAGDCQSGVHHCNRALQSLLEVPTACAEWRRDICCFDIGSAVGYSIALWTPAEVNVNFLDW